MQGLKSDAEACCEGTHIKRVEIARSGGCKATYKSFSFVTRPEKMPPSSMQVELLTAFL